MLDGAARLLDGAIADKAMICGYHCPLPVRATIDKEDDDCALTVMKA